MADVAARLRVARESAGLSIEDLSARTKIQTPILLAIEQGAFERIPGGEFFTRAFLGTYARELHLPVREVMADYDSARPAPVVLETPPPASSGRGENAPPAWALWAVAAVTLAGVIALFVMRPSPPASGEAELQPVATMGTSAPDAMRTADAADGSAVPERLTIAIRPTRRLWVTGSADGGRVLFRMLEPGDEVTIEARETLTFRVGDAGAFEYTVNGIPRKPPGRDGEVREFVITRSDSSSTHDRSGKLVMHADTDRR